MNFLSGGKMNFYRIFSAVVALLVTQSFISEDAFASVWQVRTTNNRAAFVGNCVISSESNYYRGFLLVGREVRRTGQIELENGRTSGSAYSGTTLEIERISFSGSNGAIVSNDCATRQAFFINSGAVFIGAASLPVAQAPAPPAFGGAVLPQQGGGIPGELPAPPAAERRVRTR